MPFSANTRAMISDSSISSMGDAPLAGACYRLGGAGLVTQSRFNDAGRHATRHPRVMPPAEWLAVQNADSSLISPPYPREADWHIPIGRPAWLHLHPAVIDDLLAQFGELPACRERRLCVVG